MFTSVRRRLAFSYAAIFALSLLLLGPVLYLSWARQLSGAFDATLRLAAQRQALRTVVPTGVTFGANPHFKAPPPLATQNFFYLLLAPDGRLQDNPDQVQHTGLPDVAAAREAARHGYGVFSTLHTADAGDVRLYTLVIKRAGRTVLLQAGQSLDALVGAQRQLLYRLGGLGLAAVAIATVGGVLLTRQAMRPINSAFAAQRAFIADASHELRTPLTLMRTNVEVLLEAEAVADPEDRALLEDVVAEAEHMGRLIGDLLTLARLDAGALPLARDAVDLGTLVETTTRQMAQVAARRGITLRQGDIAGVTVRGDAGRLEQVLLILLDNAVKYTAQGGTVEVTLRREGGQAVLAVRDTGCGIAADEVPRLFARFHRGAGAGARAEGSGLGLAIAAGIVEAHHGRLQVRSTLGEGSTFSVLVPLADHGTAGRRVRHASQLPR